MKKNGILAVVLAGLVMAFGMAEAQAQDMIKLRFGKLSPSLGMIRGTVAEQQGFFKKHGLDVEVTEFRGSPELNTAAISGEIDIGHTGLSSVLVLRQRNLPVKAFYVETGAAFYHLLGTPDMTSLKDAVDKGASAAVSGIGSLDYVVTRYLVKRAGLDPNKLKYVQAGNPGQRSAALEAGRVQLALSAVPETYEVLRRGKVKELAKMADYSKDFALEVLWAKEDYIAKNPEAMKRFLAAMDDASMWIRNSPDSHAMIAKYLNLKSDEAVADAKASLEEATFPTVAEHKARLKELLAGCEPLAADALENGQLKADSPAALVQQIFDLRYVQ